MKALTALFVTVALISPAFSQNVAFQRKAALQEIRKRHPGPYATPAIKPILLHTGKPITPNDKAQLVTSAKKIYAATMPAQKPWQQSNIKATDTTPTVTHAIITPSQMFQGDLVFGEAYSPIFMSPGKNEVQFSYGEPSELVVTFTAKANMIYTLNFKVTAVTDNQQFTIGDYGDNVESFTGSGMSNEFVYALIAKSTGSLMVELFSSNAEWQFNSCEITGTPIN
jgi:hypothetical protein